MITFGSLAAAGLLLTALVGVGLGIAAITALGSTLSLSTTTSTLAMMLGLAVGIDYAVFIVSRYRAELLEGYEPKEAAGRAVGTAGSAVVFAGLTVVIALAGLSVVGIPILAKMGMAAAGTVVIAVVIALTLVPALLGFLGDRVLPRRARRAARRGRVGRLRAVADGTTAGSPVAPAAAEAERQPANGGTRWARLVLRRPVAVLPWASASSPCPPSICGSGCRARSPGRPPPRSDQRGDRRADVRQPVHRPDACAPRDVQARRPRPGPTGRHRLPVRPGPGRPRGTPAALSPVAPLYRAPWSPSRPRARARRVDGAPRLLRPPGVGPATGPALSGPRQPRCSGGTVTMRTMARQRGGRSCFPG